MRGSSATLTGGVKPFLGSCPPLVTSPKDPFGERMVLSLETRRAKPGLS